MPWFIFAVLLAMCGAVVAAFIAGEEPYIESEPDESGATTRTYLGHGRPHDTHGTMLSGGPGADRHTNIFWAGCAFALLQAIFFISLLLFGMRKKDETGPATAVIIGGGVVFAGIVMMLFLSYRNYMGESAPELALALPKPTAWMVYGVWIFPVFFVFVYRYFFSSWFLTDEDMERFEAIVAKRGTPDEERA